MSSLPSAASGRPAVQVHPPDIEIVPVADPAAMRVFADLPFEAYAGDPAWHPPLRMVLRQQLDPRHNPALAHIEAECFLARRAGRIVGRIAAFANHAHLRHQHDETGHFGFLDTLPGAETAIPGLLAAAEASVRRRGLRAIAGPFNFSVNEECGLLVDGFEAPNMILMPHGRPAYAAALEAAGYAKAMDMHAYLHRMDDPASLVPPRVQRYKDRLARSPSLSVRPADLRNFEAEVALVMDIFNDAWSQNWGYVPLTKAEITHMAKELRPLLRAHSLWIGMDDGHPVCFTMMIPNVNEATRDLAGRLLPFGWAKLLWRLKGNRISTARLPLSGTRPSHQKSPGGVSLTAWCFDSCLQDQYAHGVRAIEFSWVLETNRNLIGMIELYTRDRYKTYRIYRKEF